MLYTQRLIDWLIMSGLFVAMEAEKPTAAEKKRTTHHLGVMEKIRSLRQCADYWLVRKDTAKRITILVLYSKQKRTVILYLKNHTDIYSK